MPAKPGPFIDMRDIPAAVGLLTRLPIKVNTEFALARGAAAAWAYPLVGVVVALPVAAVGMAAGWAGLSGDIAVGMALLVQVFVTGGLHEDGLADCADGFWGGWTRARRLAIMKDSQIGTYGVLALILIMGLKWLALSTLIQGGAAGWAIYGGAAVMSRAAMVPNMSRLPHARPGGLSASVGRPSGRSAALAVALGLTAALIAGGLAGLAIAALTLGLSLGLGRLARARIGGQTGDVLGGTQMCAELGFLLMAAACLA